MAHYHSDHPTLCDALGRLTLLDEVGTHVKECDPPHVIGIYGDWGSGKTSFLRALQLYLSGITDLVDIENLEHSTESEAKRDLEGIEAILAREGSRQGYPVVWFDAWRYQGEDAPIVALLHEIRRQFSPGAKLAGFMKKTLAIGAKSALLAFDQLAKDIGAVALPAAFVAKGAVSAFKVAEDYERHNFSSPLTTETIREQLDFAISKMVESLDGGRMAKLTKRIVELGPLPKDKKARLVIVIDDLDRCEPQVALRLLEGIKVYLSLKNCVFVLGVNPKRLTDHIAEAYHRDSKDGGMSIDDCRYRAKDYLDKIINIQFSFGVNSTVDELLRCKLPKLEIKVVGEDDSINYRNQILNVLSGKRYLPPNPRRIGAFTNTLLRLSLKGWPAPPEPELLVAFAYLNQFAPEIVRKMAYYDQDKYGQVFLAWCLTPSGTFEGWRPMPGFSTPQESEEASPFWDPIYEQVLHVQPLLAEWWKAHQDEEFDLRPYILLG